MNISSPYTRKSSICPAYLTFPSGLPNASGANRLCDGYPSCILVFPELPLASTTHTTLNGIGTGADGPKWQGKPCVCSLHPTINSPWQTVVASGVEDEDKYEGDSGYRYPKVHVLAKSPPSRPFFSGAFRTTRPSQHPARKSRLAKFFSEIFRKPRPSRTRTLEHTVREPQPAGTFRCRYPECRAPIRSDEAARLGGFCCDTHMW